VINLSSVKGLVALGKTFVMAYRPELLLGASVTATVGAAVLGAKGGYEARGIVDKAEAEQKRELTTKEKANLTWHCYWPAAAASLTAVGATTGLHIVHVQEKKQLAAAALMVIEEVKEDAKREIGEKVGPLSKEQQEQQLEEKAKRNKDGVAKIQDSDGTIEELYLIRDGKTGRDIWSNEQRIKEAVLEINNFIAKHGDCDLNTFYNNAGFDETLEGNDWGWSGDWIELRWDTTVRDDGRPVRRFQFVTDPKKGYDRPV